MSNSEGALIVRLGRRDVFTVQARGYLAMRCLMGELWITQHLCTKDILLKAGQRALIESTHMAVIQGLHMGKVWLSIGDKNEKITIQRISGVDLPYLARDDGADLLFQS